MAKSDVEQRTLAQRIEAAVESLAGISIVVEESGDALILSGRVDTEEAKQAAGDIAAQLAGNRRVDNDLEVENVVPVEVSDFHAGEAPAAATAGSVAEIREMDSEIDADFTDQVLSTSSLETAGADTYEEADTTYFPPTDPVVTADQRGETKVLGGFTPASTTSIEVAPSALDDRPGDEAICDAVVRELREDAATAGLIIGVHVHNGIVHLRGRVSGIEDTENAVAVAARVPGVRQVGDELKGESA